MLQAIASKKNYALVGKILWKTQPALASELETRYQPVPKPLSDIIELYERFQNLSLDMKPADARRHFCAAMLRIYHPQALTEFIFIKKGFGKMLMNQFRCKRQAVERNIREAIIMYRAYDEFREKVDEILSDIAG